MCDRITYCDVVECCEDCPKYGDDCDGDKRNDDLIRRADAIAFINSGISLDTDADREYATEMFKNIPSAEAVEVIHDTEWVAVRRDEYENFLASAEAVQGWIPCSEKLPKVGKDVLLAFTDNQCVGGRYICNDGEEIWTVSSGGGWCTPILDGDEEPIAWMPLPKPYKGGGSE